MGKKDYKCKKMMIKGILHQNPIRLNVIQAIFQTALMMVYIDGDTMSRHVLPHHIHGLILRIAAIIKDDNQTPKSSKGEKYDEDFFVIR